MELGEAGFGIGLDEGLPIDPANPDQIEPFDRDAAQNQRVGACRNRKSRATLQFPRRKSSLETRTRPKAVGKPVQLVIEYDFSSIIIELKSKLIFFFKAC